MELLLCPPQEQLKDLITSLGLTKAEVRVFFEAITGASNGAIGKTLFISSRTVKFHLSHIMKKMNMKTRCELIVWAGEQMGAPLTYRGKPPGSTDALPQGGGFNES